MSKIADILDRAADRLSKPGAWTQGANARDADGRGVSPNNPAAVCWCLSGVLYSVEPRYSVAREANDFMNRYVLVSYAHHWNDAPERTQSEVIQTLRQAADKAREAGK